jgi:hypothetical protein
VIAPPPGGACLIDGQPPNDRGARYNAKPAYKDVPRRE